MDSVQVGENNINLSEHAIARFFEAMAGKQEDLFPVLCKSLQEGENASPLLVSLLCGRKAVDKKARYIIDTRGRGIWVILGNTAVTMLRLSTTQRAILERHKLSDRRQNNKPKSNGKAIRKNMPPFLNGAGKTTHLGAVAVKVLARKVEAPKGWILSKKALMALSGLSGLTEEEVLDQFGDTIKYLPAYGIENVFAFRFQNYVFIGTRMKGWGHVELLPDISDWEPISIT